MPAVLTFWPSLLMLLGSEPPLACSDSGWFGGLRLGRLTVTATMPACDAMWGVGPTPRQEGPASHPPRQKLPRLASPGHVYSSMRLRVWAREVWRVGVQRCAAPRRQRAAPLLPPKGCVRRREGQACNSARLGPDLITDGAPGPRSLPQTTPAWR